MIIIEGDDCAIDDAFEALARFHICRSARARRAELISQGVVELPTGGTPHPIELFHPHRPEKNYWHVFAAQLANAKILTFPPR
jgi:hypothetical protein